MISYSVIKNKMNSDSDEYIATVNQGRKTDLDQIMDYMVGEGTGLTRPQALAYFEKLVQAFEHFIVMRGGVSTPLCYVRTTVTGVFCDESDTFDPKRHSIHIRISPGPRLKDLQGRLKLSKRDSKVHTPHLYTFIDIASNTTNKFATPQSVAIMKGSNLKFDSNDTAQGIFFVSEKGSIARFRVNLYSSVRTTEIHFLVPQLPPGNYTIVVQALMRRHKSITAGILRPLIAIC